MASDDDDVPETGAIFTFGKSKFAENISSKFWIRNDRICAVACGDEHTALVTENGRLYTFGSNDWGQLGLGHTKTASKPSCVKSLKHEKAKLVACGRSHTLIVTEDGKLYAFGNNGETQLGVTGMQTSPSPVLVESMTAQNIIALSAGTDHSAALTGDGKVYVWGGGSEGQLGLGEDTTECTEPTILDFDSKAISISCGYYHTAVVTEDGNLYTFGETEYGKLGLNNSDLDSSDTPQKVTGIKEKVKFVVCGGGHTTAIAESGAVYTFGNGASGQLGHGNSLLESPTPHRVERFRDADCKHASCGENFTAVITGKGHLYTFGDGRHGKLGLGDESFTNQFRPFKVARFNKFQVQWVACGGCHMMVIASPRQQNGEISSESSDEDPLMESISGQKSLNLSKISSENKEEGEDSQSPLLTSLTPRARRRQMDGGPLPPLNRTLPPIGSEAGKLPALSKTLPPMDGVDGKALKPLDKPLLAPLDKPLLAPLSEKEESKFSDKKKKDSDSGEESESEEESDEESGENSDLNKTHVLKENPANKTKQLSLVRPADLPKARKDGSESDSETDSDESDDDSDDNDQRHAPPKKKGDKKASSEEKKAEKEDDAESGSGEDSEETEDDSKNKESSAKKDIEEESDKDTSESDKDKDDKKESSKKDKDETDGPPPEKPGFFASLFGRKNKKPDKPKEEAKKQEKEETSEEDKKEDTEEKEDDKKDKKNDKKDKKKDDKKGKDKDSKKSDEEEEESSEDNSKSENGSGDKDKSENEESKNKDESEAGKDKPKEEAKPQTKSSKACTIL
ncbi:X-linked retinitis pigmentosa GTPase regulator-like isoform X1 [Branchiostoma floridae]|uniref:X-linked retinitis pigmentosa GTPase regulator n=1 Tax=Branchiostoma floridae TaxID=7739 RepID=A0A9J7MYU2_BRAFL|nr:X-linked retinitis pigmentosa GTPase regulator-like isoform X1 [Branchiostoma floridae]